jgi:hypothetical protein
MFEKVKPARDAFTFSLGGMRAVAPFVAAPIIADDRINKAVDERMNAVRDDHDRQPNLWLSFLRQSVYAVSAYQEFLWRSPWAAFSMNQSKICRN